MTSTSCTHHVLLSIVVVSLITPLVVSFSGAFTPRHDAAFGWTASRPTTNTNFLSIIATRKKRAPPLHVAKDAIPSSVIPTISVRRPQVHWTVPGMNLAFQNQITGEWRDTNGPRDGPPRNYWRQSSDERTYKRDMDVLDAALLDNLSDNGNSVFNEIVDAVEKKGGARFPWVSRKLLGTWAPILHAGEKVVCDQYNKDDSTDEGAEENIECSVVIEIQRSAGPKYAPKNYYGTFYANLEEDEEIRVLSSDCTVSELIRVSKARKTIVELERAECAGKLEAPLYLGNITYLSDYILIQRRSDGSVDLWLRMDDSYLGNLDADAA